MMQSAVNTSNSASPQQVGGTTSQSWSMNHFKSSLRQDKEKENKVQLKGVTGTTGKGATAGAGAAAATATPKVTAQQNQRPPRSGDGDRYAALQRFEIPICPLPYY
jgi:hypothetical protein